MQMKKQELSEKMERLFNREDLEDLCFQMDIADDNIPGETRKAMVRELILYCERHGRLKELVEVCAKNRPNETWGTATLKSIQLEIYRLQSETLEAFASRDFIKVDSKLEETEDLLEDGLKQWPGNIVLLDLRGYHHKNVAMQYLKLAMNDAADKHLDIAEKTFRIILTQDKNDANAWNGLGSVYWLRFELDKAEANMRKALEINPDHSAAQQDLANLLEYRAKAKR